MTILDFFDASRTERPNAPAINDISYAELHAGSLRVAQRLAAHGLRAGERLAIYSENRPAFIYAYLAALRLRAIVVPVNVLYRAAELEHVIADAGVSLAVAGAATLPFLDGLVPRERAIAADDLERWAGEAVEAPLPKPAPSLEDDAFIIYTSGTTGRSKGAVMTHGNVSSIAAQVVSAWRWTSRDTLYAALPFFHTHGLSAALNGTLTAGGRLLFDERFEAKRALEMLRRDDVTMFFGVPTMYVRLLEALDGAPPSLRLFVSGSAALPPDVFAEFERRFGVQILERYGATEFGFSLSNRYAGPRVPGSVGVPMPGMRARIACEGTQPPAPGEVGELLIAGPSVTRGYWNDPGATAGAFVTGDDGTRWYRSGDLATYDAEHDVFRIVGRLKELIITGGFNVYPLEVENELNRLDGIVASAVVGLPDAARGELPVAFVECNGPIEPETVRAALAARLASFKVPREVHVVESLPRNALGKIEKHRLKALVAERAS